MSKRTRHRSSIYSKHPSRWLIVASKVTAAHLNPSTGNWTFATNSVTGSLIMGVGGGSVSSGAYVYALQQPQLKSTVFDGDVEIKGQLILSANEKPLMMILLSKVEELENRLKALEGNETN